MMWKRAWKVSNGLVVTHSDLTGPTFCCRKAWSLSLQFSQSQCIGPALVETRYLILAAEVWIDSLRSPDLYVLKKRAAYPVVLKEFLAAKAENKFFVKPILNAHTLNKDVVNYVQYNRFETAVDLLPISPSSFLGQQLAPNSSTSAFHDREDLRRNYLYNVTLANKFWKSWFKGYLPTLQGRCKWRVACQNLVEGQLVLVGNAENTNKRRTYRLGRIHCVHTQLCRGKEIACRATIVVLKNFGSKEIDYVLRNVSKIALL